MTTREAVKKIYREIRINCNYTVNIPEADGKECYEVLCGRIENFPIIFKSIVAHKESMGNSFPADETCRKIWAVEDLMRDNYYNTNNSKMHECISNRRKGAFLNDWFSFCGAPDKWEA